MADFGHPVENVLKLLTVVILWPLLGPGKKKAKELLTFSSSLVSHLMSGFLLFLSHSFPLFRLHVSLPLIRP